MLIDGINSGTIDYVDGSVEAADMASGIVKGKNVIINGGFNVWQRGTALTTSGYTADRWFINSSNMNSDNVGFIIGGETFDGMRLTRTTATGLCAMYQLVELPKTGKKSHFNGKYTLSFYAKMNNGVTSTPTVAVKWVDGSSFTNSSIVTTTQIGTETLTDAVTKFTYEVDFDSAAPNATNKAFYVAFATDSNLQIGEYVEVGQVQLEQGTVATEFEQRHIGEELALCQRYYYNHNVPASSGFFCTINNDAVYRVKVVQFPVEMRIIPTVEFTATASSAFTSPPWVDASSVHCTSLRADNQSNGYSRLSGMTADAEL